MQRHGWHIATGDARRFAAEMPLAVLLPLTILLPLLWAAYGIAMAALIWLARESWHFEREVADLYEPDSPELTKEPQPGD